MVEPKERKLFTGLRKGTSATYAAINIFQWYLCRDKREANQAAKNQLEEESTSQWERLVLIKKYYYYLQL